MRWPSRAALATIFSVALCIAVAVPRPATAALSPEDLSQQARRVLELTNQERSKAGLVWLQWNDILAATANDYARDLVSRRYFSHTSLEGTMPWDRAKAHGYPTYGWGSCYVGENLAQGFATPEDAMKGWLASESHKANLLKPEYRELGVGVVADASGRKTWVQNFGSRPGVLPVVINQGAAATDSPAVTISISSEDVTPNGQMGKPVQMMVSNRSDFAGASWIPYSRMLAWSLDPTPGLKKVFVRLRDAKGTVVESGDEIELTGRQQAGIAPISSEPLFQAMQSSNATVAVRSEESPQFRMGFGTLAELIPEVVGRPIENEHPDIEGNTVQRTTTGLMVWRKADNWTAFTDGDRTWVNGPLGLQVRGNEERFPWEE